MTLSPTIDVGSILVVVTIATSAIGAHFTIKARLDSIERKMQETIVVFGARLDRHEETIAHVAGHVQRLIGRMDDRPPTWTHSRIEDQR